jgi:5-(carboxyamino)imidazole ribonucleotide synthase
MNYFSSDFKLEFSVADNWAKCYCLTPRNLTYTNLCFDPSDEAPCKIACDQFFKGDLMDFETVYNWKDRCFDFRN